MKPSDDKRLLLILGVAAVILVAFFVYITV